MFHNANHLEELPDDIDEAFQGLHVNASPNRNPWSRSILSLPLPPPAALRNAISSTFDTTGIMQPHRRKPSVHHNASTVSATTADDIATLQQHNQRLVTALVKLKSQLKVANHHVQTQSVIHRNLQQVFKHLEQENRQLKRTIAMCDACTHDPAPFTPIPAFAHGHLSNPTLEHRGQDGVEDDPVADIQQPTHRGSERAAVMGEYGARYGHPGPEDYHTLSQAVYDYADPSINGSTTVDGGVGSQTAEEPPYDGHDHDIYDANEEDDMYADDDVDDETNCIQVEVDSTMLSPYPVAVVETGNRAEDLDILEDLPQYEDIEPPKQIHLEE